MRRFRQTPSALFLVISLSLLAACGGGGGGGSGTSAASQAATYFAATHANINGTVTDRSGAPVAGVTVSLFHHNNNTTVKTVTDASGAYTFSDVDAVTFADYVVYAEKAGLAFVPQAGSSGAKAERFDFDGQYRTALRFAALPAGTAKGANFMSLRAGDKLASLPRSGQQQSLAPGDDAARAAGVAWPAQRFIDNGDGSISDRLTGLVWLKNAACQAPTNWKDALAAANSLASGTCGLTDGSTAGQWRMPNVNELESLVDISQVNPALPAGRPFTNVSTTRAYWSSTTYTAATGQAMAIRLSDGRWINDADTATATGTFSNNKTTAANLLWAVKSGPVGAISVLATGVYDGQGGASFGTRDDAMLKLGTALPGSRFIDNGDGTVADTLTGLTWLKQADCIRKDWDAALAAVNTLADGQCGLKDGSKAGQWRMPNRNEMLSLSDRAPTFPQANYFNGIYTATTAVNGPRIFSQFVAFDYYWTASSTAANTNEAWAIYSCDFGIYNVPKNEMRLVLAVR